MNKTERVIQTLKEHPTKSNREKLRPFSIVIRASLKRLSPLGVASASFSTGRQERARAKRLPTSLPTRLLKAAASCL